jgi:predicted  nucleic acid-binding Zn-ribbon protein
MNAVMREHYEVPVVANETNEAKLDSLHTSVDEVKAEVRSLRDKVDQNFNTMNQGQSALRDRIDANFNTLNQGQNTLRDKIDATRSELTQRIEQVRSELSSDIKALRTDFSADMKALRIEFSATNVAVVQLGGKIASIRWFASGAVTLVILIEAGIRIGTHFHWF